MTSTPTVIDALGHPVPLGPPPRRIVSLVPSVTECVFDLGAGATLVGRTAYCISPAERVAALADVGGPRTFDPAAVARLAPDLVLANAEENDRGRVETLRALGLRVHVAFPRTLEEAAGFLMDLGRLLRTEAEAARASGELRRILASPPPASVPGACLVWKDPFLAASTDTLTSALMAAAGVANVVAPDQEGRRYPPVPLAALGSARVVWLPSEPYEFSAADAQEVEATQPGCRALRVPGEWLTWYGCRMATAVADLRTALARALARPPRLTNRGSKDPLSAEPRPLP